MARDLGTEKHELTGLSPVICLNCLYAVLPVLNILNQRNKHTPLILGSYRVSNINSITSVSKSGVLVQGPGRRLCKKRD